MFDLIGLDWGSIRCGVAFGSSDTGLVIPSQDLVLNNQIVEYLELQIQARGTKKIILGLPTNFKGNLTQVTDKVLEFGEELRIVFPSLEIIKFDERGSTKQARDSLNHLGHNSKYSVDNLAAAKILEAYIEFGTRK